MYRKPVSALLCLAILFGMVAIPQIAGAAERPGQIGSLSDGEMIQYTQMQADADQLGLLDKAGGTEDSTGTIILATLGVLVLIGIVCAAAAA